MVTGVYVLRSPVHSRSGLPCRSEDPLTMVIEALAAVEISQPPQPHHLVGGLVEQLSASSFVTITLANSSTSPSSNLSSAAYGSILTICTTTFGSTTACLIFPTIPLLADSSSSLPSPGLRNACILVESFRLDHKAVQWFVLMDDGTIVCLDNLVTVLSNHSMAYGGGGIAISYPLVEALSGMLDKCIERYPRLYDSDDQLHACISELGIPLSREYGFHQRSICYDKRKMLTFAISIGYVVQVFPTIIPPQELEHSELTYNAWNKLN
ncbi:hypothetical protein Cni_G08836 [Canna indica]|uniref:Uncharacterized protein n=1 Tax=Canna indica TaxID=4628 RepID=A0AAQ3K1F7_9LILI|nr:hypothetical protein Cni_G08836 [Canna indica]